MITNLLALLLLSPQAAPPAITPVTPPVDALPEDTKSAYRTHFSPSCEKWRLAQASSVDDSRARVGVYRMWVMGYITGFNIVGPDKTGDILGATPHEEVYGAIDGYCARNPSYSVVDAMRPIAAALIRRRQGTPVTNFPASDNARRAKVVAPITCADWDRHRENALMRLAHIVWVSGYLTAYNRFGRDPTGDAIGTSDQPLIEEGVNKWCAQNPSTLLIGAIAPLIKHVAAERAAGRLPLGGMRPNEKFTTSSLAEPQSSDKR